MVSFAVLRNVSRRSLVQQAIMKNQKRCMSLGGHHGPPPKWEGIDKIVRSYVPEDHQLAMAVLGGYFSLYLFYSLVSSLGGKKKVEPVVVKAAPVAVSGEIPDVDSPGFDAFLDSEAFMKLLDNEEQLKGLLG